MRLCRFNGDRLGVVEGDRIKDVTSVVQSLPAHRWPFPPGDPLIANLAKLMPAITRAAAAASERPISEVAIDAQDPAIHHGVHNKQLEGLERPVEKLGLFLKATSSLAGPSDGITLSWPDRRSDYEAELVVVIGKTARHVSAEDAMSHIAGYCVGLDISVRGAEERSFRKSADTYTVIGPWLTTSDEIEDPERLGLWLSLNGTTRQHSSTAAMTVGIPRLIEIASAAYTLHPGDLLMTGTPEGVGPLAPGDIIVAGCEGLGEMTARVS
jgi:2,4-didehydro-3-deoxy-L-rhamnonate hydrolase